MDDYIIRIRNVTGSPTCIMCCLEKLDHRFRPCNGYPYAILACLVEGNWQPGSCKPRDDFLDAPSPGLDNPRLVEHAGDIGITWFRRMRLKQFFRRKVIGECAWIPENKFVIIDPQLDMRTAVLLVKSSMKALFPASAMSSRKAKSVLRYLQLPSS